MCEQIGFATTLTLATLAPNRSLPQPDPRTTCGEHDAGVGAWAPAVRRNTNSLWPDLRPAVVTLTARSRGRGKGGTPSLGFATAARDVRDRRGLSVADPVDRATRANVRCRRAARPDAFPTARRRANHDHGNSRRRLIVAQGRRPLILAVARVALGTDGLEGNESSLDSPRHVTARRLLIDLVDSTA